MNETVFQFFLIYICIEKGAMHGIGGVLTTLWVNY